jgi:hypothetical protein
VATTMTKADRAEVTVREAVDKAREFFTESEVRRIVEAELNKKRNS